MDVGTKCVVVVLSPSWPLLFCPQQKTSPSTVHAQLWEVPSEMPTGKPAGTASNREASNTAASIADASITGGASIGGASTTGASIAAEPGLPQPTAPSNTIPIAKGTTDL